MSYNMSQSSYYAYCNAYIVCFVDDGWNYWADSIAFHHAVKAGIIFG